MADTIRVLVAFSDDSDRTGLQEAFLGDTSLEVVGYSDEYDESWDAFLNQKSDVLVVACDSVDAATTQLIDRAAKHRPERPIVVATYGPQNGSLRDAFEAGADDVLTYPLSPESLRFTLEKVLARRRGATQAG